MTSILRFLIDRLRGRETLMRVDLAGRPAVLSISGLRELKRAREIGEEAELHARMLAHLQADDTVLDIGANIGVVSVMLALHRPRGGGRVHAFEPEPVNFGRLERNLALNSLEGGVVPHRLALGAAEGEAELHVRPGAGEGRHSLTSSRGATSSVRVPLATMASFADGAGAAPDLVKIDVEGAEGEVLAGMAGLLPDRRPRDIFVEIHPKGGGDRMPSGETIHDWLEARGYALVWERRDGSRSQRHYR
jgi:FkbM family methyltransferase